MSDDLISRQAAIEMLATMQGRYTSKAALIQNSKIWQQIKDLPSARPKGKWIMKADPYGFFDEIPVCSECGCTTEMRKTYNFCPYCGSDNREVE